MTRPILAEFNPRISAISDLNPEEQLEAAFIVVNLNEEARLYTEGYNYTEIAVRCGFSSKTTAKNRIDGCAARLRNLLGLTYEQRRRQRMYAKNISLG